MQKGACQWQSCLKRIIIDSLQFSEIKSELPERINAGKLFQSLCWFVTLLYELAQNLAGKLTFTFKALSD